MAEEPLGSFRMGIGLQKNQSDYRVGTFGSTPTSGEEQETGN